MLGVWSVSSSRYLYTFPLVFEDGFNFENALLSIMSTISPKH